MKVKKLAISVFAVIFVLFTAVSFFAYNNSTSINISTESGSFAQSYAKKHNMNCTVISGSEQDEVLSLENFDYNENGTITAYNGNSENVAVPERIENIVINKIGEKAFANAKKLKEIYIPDGVDVDSETVKSLKVYICDGSSLAEKFKKDGVNFTYYTDSQNINFRSADIPFEYDVENNEVTINKYNGTGEAVIPAYISGNPVTVVNIDALNSGITSMFIPSTVTEIGKGLYTPRYDGTFVVGILIALVGLTVAIFGTMKAELSTKEKTFLGVSFITESYALSIASVVLGIVYYLLVPVAWVGIIFAVALAAFGLVTFMKVKVAVDEVEKVGEKVKVQSQYIKMLTVDVQNLMNRAATPEAIEAAKKVYEAVRYSDPMSNEALAVIEAKITVKFDEFANEVNSGGSKVTGLADELVTLVKERNNKCRVLK